MKHLYALFPFLAVILFMTAGCSDEDYSSEESKSDLELVRSELKFGPGADTDTIYYSSSRPVKVVAEAGWISVKEEDKKAIITVTASTLPDSRSGIITLSDEYKSIRVPIYQSGNYMSVATKEYTTGYKADTTIISVRANMDYDVEISAEGASWLKAEKDKNSCKFYIAEYDGKAVRQATATFSSGKNVYKVNFTQIDVRGTYTATFSDYDENNELVGYKGTFELTDNGLDIGGFIVPLTLNPTTGQITIYGGQYVGVYKTYFLYTSISSEEGYVTWNSATSYTGELTIDEDNVPSYTFGNDGSWTDYTIDGFTIDAYSAKTDPPVKANRLGTLLNFINLEMVKNTNTETPASLSKKRISKNAPTWNGRASHPRNLWKVKN